jgi:O-acetyl-ADP-ribose deacetylase (regulator of RNase III)
MEVRQGNTLIIVAVGDITEEATDAVVNAANSRLAGGGGVDGAIHARGGPDIMRELDVIRAQTGGCPVGQAVITGGGRLKARYCIHTVGPVYSGTDEDPRLLADCYRNCLKLAQAHGVKTLAFPSISTGVYRYPIAAAAPVAVGTVLAEMPRYDFAVIRFILFSAGDYAVYKAVLSADDRVTIIKPD